MNTKQINAFTIVYPRKSFNRRTKQGQSGTCSSYALQGGGRPKVNWFWYFAVREELRGKGFSYILENVVEEKNLADDLYEQLRASSGYFKYQPLSTSAEDNSSDRDSRWKININVEIETDDI